MKPKETKTKEAKRPDTPLATSPKVPPRPDDLKSVLTDINTRAAARQASIDESNKKLSDARLARRKEKSDTPVGSTRLHGLASFSDRTKLTQ